MTRGYAMLTVSRLQFNYCRALANSLATSIFQCTLGPTSFGTTASAADLSSMPSHVVGRKEPPLLNETIGANLRHTVERTPDSPAVISTFQGIQLSYEQFWSEVQRVAAGFAALGMQKGDRLGLWACNSAEWTIVQYAAAEIGLIMVSLNPAYRNYELEYTLERAGVSCLVLGRSFKDQNLVKIAAAVQPEVLSLQTCIVLPEHDVESRRFEDTTLPDGWLRYEELQVLGEGSTAVATAHAQANRLRPEEAINIQFTSGTTGRPKAATLSSYNILNNARFLGDALRYTENDRVCIPVPLFHCFGQVMGNLACTTHGAAMCYPFPWFDAAATLCTAASERCTSLYGVPSMFIKQLELLETNKDLIDLSSLRTGVMAGSPCPVEVMRAVRSKMHMEDVSIGFGMTETSPISFQTALDDPERRRIYTVGKVHPHVEAKVVDPATGTIVPRGAPGELFVRGYNVMLGYYGDEKATREAIDADGWMHTGDLATLDDEGYLSIVGRSKDTVIRGGENLFPREIEEYLHQHPSVIDVQVFGVPDKVMQEELCAWVRLREGAQESTDDLRQWAQRRISRHKVPRYWKVVTEFPATTSGKPQKYIMREQAIQELELHESKKDMQL